jgi:ubiquinol-cytochrome c reductase cytochrome c subunit
MTRRRLLVPFAVIFFGLSLAVFVMSNPTQAVESNASTGLNGALLTADSSSPAPKSLVELGKTLFVENCSACHGVNAQGSVVAPNLVDLGPATIDLWIRTGWMPLAAPGIQPINKPPKFTIPQTNAIVAYVTSLGPLGPKIPVIDLRKADISEGFSLFSLNCAACHTITGAGDALANGVHAPSLHGVAAEQIAEAIRTGPGNMPRFGPGTISHQHLVDIVGYVVKEIQHPDSPGGLGLGGVGPVAEGFVGLFVGVGGAMLIAYWIGDRTEEDEERSPHGGDHEGAHPEGVASV